MKENFLLIQLFLKKFEEIANNSSSDQMKAKEIDEIFENQGYYIPLKIYIGGIIINRYNDKNYKLFKEDINLSGEDIRKIFINENTQIIGGEKVKKILNFGNKVYKFLILILLNAQI